MLASKILNSIIHRTAFVKLLTRSSSSSIHSFHQNGNSISSNILCFGPNPQIKVKLPMVGFRAFEEPPNYISRILPSTLIIPMGFPLDLPVQHEEPPPETKIEKQCARMIKIRRRKMRKHKLKKLRKKMKFVYQAIKLRRKKLKAKAFEEEIFTKIDAANEFNAEEWVQEMARKAHTDSQTLAPKIQRPPRPTVYVFPASNKRR